MGTRQGRSRTIEAAAIDVRALLRAASDGLGALLAAAADARIATVDAVSAVVDAGVKDYDFVVAGARAVAEDKHPHADPAHWDMFARGAAYLVTGYRRGFADSPSRREITCLGLIDGRDDIGTIKFSTACRALVPICDPNITVYRYGTPWWAEKDLAAKEKPDVVFQQIVLAHQLRNTLVEITRDADTARAEVDRRFPQVREVDEALAAVTAEKEQLRVAIAKRKAERRTRAVKIPESAYLRAAQGRTKELREKLKGAKAEVRELASPFKAEIKEREQAAIAALYPRFVQERGLFWAVYNDVTAHHRVAVRQVIKRRESGRPSELRFRRFTGEGALHVQLQRSKGTPRRSPESLANGTHPLRNFLRIGTWMPPEDWAKLPLGERRRQARSSISLRIGDEQVTIPAIIHRMLPPEADITGARLVARKRADRTRFSVSVTAAIPDPLPRTTGAAVAVHFGWRGEKADDDDAAAPIRVATWQSTAPIAIPDNVKDVVRADDSTTSGIVILPGAWRQKLAEPDLIRAQRDKALEPVRATLVEWLHQYPYPVDADGVDPVAKPTAAHVEKWRSPRRFVTLTNRWRDNPDSYRHPTAPKAGFTALLAALDAWRKADLRSWRKEAAIRDRIIGRRTDAWCRVAAWLSSVAGTIVLDDTDLAELIRTTTAETAEDPTPAAVTRIPAKQRVDGSPGDLRAKITATALRDGLTEVTVSALNLSREHTCGHIGEEPPVTGLILCRGCGRYYDRDRNATSMMLIRAFPEALSA